MGNCGTRFRQKPLKDPAMTHNQWALFILLQELLDNPALTHKEVFRRLSQAGLQDLISPDRHGP